MLNTADHVTQPNMIFVCFDIHDTKTLNLLITITMLIKIIKVDESESNGIVKWKNHTHHKTIMIY